MADLGKSSVDSSAKGGAFGRLFGDAADKVLAEAEAAVASEGQDEGAEESVDVGETEQLAKAVFGEREEAKDEDLEELKDDKGKEPDTVPYPRVAKLSKQKHAALKERDEARAGRTAAEAKVAELAGQVEAVAKLRSAYTDWPDAEWADQGLYDASFMNSVQALKETPLVKAAIPEILAHMKKGGIRMADVTKPAAEVRKEAPVADTAGEKALRLETARSVQSIMQELNFKPEFRKAIERGVMANFDVKTFDPENLPNQILDVLKENGWTRETVTAPGKRRTVPTSRGAAAAVVEEGKEETKPGGEKKAAKDFKNANEHSEFTRRRFGAELAAAMQK